MNEFKSIFPSNQFLPYFLMTCAVALYGALPSVACGSTQEEGSGSGSAALAAAAASSAPVKRAPSSAPALGASSRYVVAEGKTSADELLSQVKRFLGAKIHDFKNALVGYSTRLIEEHVLSESEESRILTEIQTIVDDNAVRYARAISEIGDMKFLSVSAARDVAKIFEENYDDAKNYEVTFSEIGSVELLPLEAAQAIARIFRDNYELTRKKILGAAKKLSVIAPDLALEASLAQDSAAKSPRTRSDKSMDVNRVRENYRNTNTLIDRYIAEMNFDNMARDGVVIIRQSHTIKELIDANSRYAKNLADVKEGWVTFGEIVDAKIPGGKFLFDLDVLSNVLNNFMSNAVKYTGGWFKKHNRRYGGTVHLNIILVASPTNPKFKTLEILVVDNGPGIDPHKIAKIGEWKYAGDTTGGRDSNGVGLCGVNDQIRAHGGVMIKERVDERVNSAGGSRFGFQIDLEPVSEEDASDAPVSSSSEETGPPSVRQAWQ
jgi:signal transduction histidine kinase